MFGWLREKINKKMENEMRGCILQNFRFVEFYNSKDKLNPSLNSFVEEVDHVSRYMKNKLDSGVSLSSEDNSKLLDVNMNCRRIWANEFGGSDLKFDKEFPTK